ncbi:peptide deformylase 1 domain protein, partial [Clostridioides difficile DA00195]
VEKIDEKIIQLLDDMAETMYDADGVGGSALCPQCIIFVSKS